MISSFSRSTSFAQPFGKSHGPAGRKLQADGLCCDLPNVFFPAGNKQVLWVAKTEPAQPGRTPVEPGPEDFFLS